MNIINKARQFCILKHSGQKRKYTNENYSEHPKTVVKILKVLREKDNSITDDLLVAAYLHDILEDTNTTEAKIKEEFGLSVLNLVKEVTGYGNIKTREGLILKLADMLSNLYNIPTDTQYLKKRIKHMNIIQKDLHNEKSLKELIENSF